MKTVEWEGSRPGGEILDFSDEKSVSYPYTGSARGAAQTQRMTLAHRPAQGLNAVQALMATSKPARGDGAQPPEKRGASANALGAIQGAPEMATSHD